MHKKVGALLILNCLVMVGGLDDADKRKVRWVVAQFSSYKRKSF